jgi:hypothetical protein
MPDRQALTQAHPGLSQGGEQQAVADRTRPAAGRGVPSRARIQDPPDLIRGQHRHRPLRRWLDKTSGGETYLPVYQAGARYRLHHQVSTDWHEWQQLLPHGPAAAGSENLEAALALVRGRPFDGIGAGRYAWAENLKQHMISMIVDASHQLARRRLTEGRWRAAEAAVVVGLSVEPGMERLWRARILAAHASRNPGAVKEAVDRMLAIADQLGGDLETETQQLLTQLRDNKPTPDLTPVL